MTSQHIFDIIKKNYPYILGGSRAISMQVNNFRKVDDYDVMIDGDCFPFIKMLCEKNNLKIEDTKYGKEHIKTIKTEDSKIDLIFLGVGAIRNLKDYIIDKNGINILHINKIINYKIELLKNFENIDIKNKHLQDLLFLFKNEKFEFKHINGSQ